MVAVEMFTKLFVFVLSLHAVLSQNDDDVIRETMDELQSHSTDIKSRLMRHEMRYNDTKSKLYYTMEKEMFKKAKFLAELEVNAKNLAEGASLRGFQTEGCLKELKPQLDALISKQNTSCFPGKHFVNTKRELERVKYFLSDLDDIIRKCSKKSEVFDVDAFKNCATVKLEEDVTAVSGFELLLDYYLDVAIANTITCLDTAYVTLENDGFVLLKNFEKCLRN